MSLHDDFINKVVTNPEWEKIRSELCTPIEQYEVTTFEVKGGFIHFGKDNRTDKQFKNDDLFSRLCWYVNQGPGYCRTAPHNIKKYLKRLGVQV